MKSVLRAAASTASTTMSTCQRRRSRTRRPRSSIPMPACRRRRRRLQLHQLQQSSMSASPCRRAPIAAACRCRAQQRLLHARHLLHRQRRPLHHQREQRHLPELHGQQRHRLRAHPDDRQQLRHWRRAHLVGQQHRRLGGQPASPPLYAGVLFYQDRRVPNGTMSSTSKIFTISSLNTVTLTGAIYFPNNRIDISSINNSAIDHQRLHRLDRPLHQVLVVQQQLHRRLRGARRHAARRHHDHDDDLEHDHQGQGLRIGRSCASAIDVRRPAPLAADRSGNVMIEFALALPILVLADGRAARSRQLQPAEVGDAAGRAGRGAVRHHRRTDAAKVNTTAQNATGLTGVTATNTCSANACRARRSPARRPAAAARRSSAMSPSGPPRRSIRS